MSSRGGVAVAFPGEFETHLTVDLPDGAAVTRLADWARARGLKFTHIVLGRGRAPSQPMVTRYGRGRLGEEREAARALAAELAGAGFVVSRVKVEVAPGNTGVPRTDSAASAVSAGRYFEHHVKLLLKADADLEAIAAMVRPCGGHLSRNAIKARADGRQERFVTQRCHGVGRGAARRRFEKLLAALAAARLEVVDVEEEYVVYDSNLAADDGWMDETREVHRGNDVSTIG
jgi:hypothetical protein